MAATDELLMPYLRSCQKEISEPIEGKTTGQIPEWLHGNLIRVGPGLLEIGPDKFNHIFDGMALLRLFSIKDGKATYRNKFLRSDAYRKNTEANRIVVTEFGTRGVPDLCQTIFQRVSSMFSTREFSDNDLVNVVKFSDEFYSFTEGNFIWRFDPDNLDSINKVDQSKFVPVRRATAHPHEGKDGTVYNIGLMKDSPAYALIKFPPKKTPDSGAFSEGSVLGHIQPARKLYPSYFHSFGMSENYFIIVEQPLYFSIPKMMWVTLTLDSYMDCLHYESKNKTAFNIMRRDNGQVLPIKFLSDSMMLFHHINAYEEDGQLVVDICCYDDGNIFSDLLTKSLRNHPDQYIVKGIGKRFVFPLEIKGDQDKADNLVSIKGSKAKAFLQKDGTVYCEPELHSSSDNLKTELPRINYDFNGVKYRYYYAVGAKENVTCLVKIDFETGTTLYWSEQDALPSEPVFVPSKDSTAEDDGVILSSVLYKTDDKKVTIIVLDAKTMAELGRTEFATESSVPADFHGIFVEAK